jgi:hypothetical protein
MLEMVRRAAILPLQESALAAMIRQALDLSVETFLIFKKTDHHGMPPSPLNIYKS